MGFRRSLLTFVLFYLAALTAAAQANEVENSHLEGSITYGFGTPNIMSPTADFKINPAQAISFTGEKSFSFFHLYLEAMGQYMKTTGNLNYNYTGATSTYIASNVNVALDSFGAGFGLRFKIIEGHAIKPFIEAGGIGNYIQLTYDSSLRTPAVVAAGTDFKTQDSVLDFGSYAEAGLEVDLTPVWGFQIADRYIDSNTRPIATMKEEMIHYSVNLYVLSLFTHF